MADQLAFDIIGRDKASSSFARVGKSMDALERRAAAVQSSVGKLEGGLGALKGAALGAAAGVGAMEVWKRTIGAASDLNETVSKTRTIFGASSAGIEKWAGTAADSIGMSKRAALDGVSAFGNLFQQIGLTGDQSTKMSKSLVQLTADFASFHNADPAEVMDAMLSATRGEYDALQRFVPTASAAAVEAQALADSGKASAKELTNADKAVGLYNLILKDAGKAQGDFARTSTSAANQQRILMARVEDTGAQIGGVLLPAYQGFLGVINDVGPINALAAAVAIVFGEKIGKSLDLARVQVGVWGLEMRDAVRATSAASGPTNKFASALSVGKVAAGGMGKALGGLVGMLGGPWGIALAGASIAAGLLTQQAAEQRQKTEALKNALKELAGTYKDIKAGSSGTAEALVRNNENLQDLVLSSHEFGVSTGDIVRAINGEKGALDTLNAAYDAQIAKLKEEIATRAGGVESIEERKRLQERLDKLEAEKAAINGTIDARNKSKRAADLVASGLKDETEAAGKSTEAQIKLSDAMSVLADETATAEDKTKALKSAEDALYGRQIDQAEATEAYAASIDDLTESVKDNGHTLNVNTKAGRANRDSIEARIEASKKMFEADIAAGVGVDKATAAHKARIAAMRRELKQMGFNEKEINDLIKTYGNVPTDIETLIHTKGYALTQDKLLELLAIQRSLNKGISVSRARAEMKKQLSFASGGFVDGPGTETSDDIPAWLSKGEFVQNAAAVKYYGADLMDKLNKREVPKWAVGYARGGLVAKFPFDVSKAKIPSKQSIYDKYGGSAYLGHDPGNAIAEILRVARHFYGGARVSSGFRFGDPGYHGRGLAADLIGGGAAGMVRMARGFYGISGRLLEEIHSGGGGFFVKNGQRVGSGYYRSVIGEHYNHVHIAARKDALANVFDRGGYLMPGLSLAYNGTGRPERVLGPGQGAPVVNINNSIFASERQLEDMVVRALERAKQKGKTS